MEHKDLVALIAENGLTEKQYNECLQLIIDKKNNKIDIDWQEIISIYNLPMAVDTLKRANGNIFGGSFVAEYLNNTSKPQDKNNYTQTLIKEDGSCVSTTLIEMNEQQSKDKNYLLQAHGFDTNEWQLVSAKNSQWNQNSKKNGMTTLYSSNITVKPIDSCDLSLERIGKFFDNLDRNYSLQQLKNNIKLNDNYLQGEKLLLINIADLHYNLQATMFTTNNDYNCDIAEDLFFMVINDILSRTNIYTFNKVMFVVGGDMLNSEASGTTTKGTPQDNCLHFYDAYEKLCAMTIKAIDILKEVAPVEVIYVVGNHDEVAGFKLAKYIDAWFREDLRVSVDYTPIARKYKMFGSTLLCFAHDGKVAKLPAIISNEAREYWSQAETVEVFLQHLHSEQVLTEDNNIRIQRLPTISAKSKWSNDMGYNSRRQCKTFIFDKKDGLTDVLYTKV